MMLRDEVARIFERAGWHRIDTRVEDQNGVTYRTDVYWFPLIGADGDVRPPVIVFWDRGDDWEPQQHVAGEWSRWRNHGDVLTSLRRAAERG